MNNLMELVFIETKKHAEELDIKKAEIDEKSNQLQIHWRNGHFSSFSLPWIYEVANINQEDTQYDPLFKYKLWNNSSFKENYPEVPYEDVCFIMNINQSE